MNILRGSALAAFALVAAALSACGGSGGGGTGGGGGGVTPPTPTPPPQYVNVYYLINSADNPVDVFTIVDVAPAEGTALNMNSALSVNAVANPPCCGFTNPVLGGDKSTVGYSLYGIPNGDLVFTMVNGSTASGAIPVADPMCVTYQPSAGPATLPITQIFWKDYATGNPVTEPSNISSLGSCGTNSDDL